MTPTTYIFLLIVAAILAGLLMSRKKPARRKMPTRQITNEPEEKLPEELIWKVDTVPTNWRMRRISPGLMVGLHRSNGSFNFTYLGIWFKTSGAPELVKESKVILVACKEFDPTTGAVRTAKVFTLSIPYGSEQVKVPRISG